VWKPDLGGDPNAVTAEWRHCRVCELIGAAQEAGPPKGGGAKHGWRLVLNHNH